MLGKIKKIICVGILCFSSFISKANAVDLHWSGYFGSIYEDDSRSKKYGSYDAFVLSIITNVNVNKNTRLYSSVDWEHAPYFEAKLNDDGTKGLNPRSSGEVTLSNAYAEYSIADPLKIRVGKFFTPIGLQNLLFYALPTYPYLKIPRDSVYLKGGTPQTDAVFYQRYAQGVWITGNYPLKQMGEISYDVFSSNGSSFVDHTDDNNNEGIGGRVQITPPLPIKIAPLVSFYSDEFNSATPKSPVWKTQTSVIPGVEVEWGSLVIKGEYASERIKNSDGSKSNDSSAFYSDVYYTFLNKYTPYVRYESYDPNNDKNNDQESQITVGISYHLVPWLSQIKLQVRFYDYEDNSSQDDYNVLGLGIALGFM